MLATSLDNEGEEETFSSHSVSSEKTDSPVRLLWWEVSLLNCTIEGPEEFNDHSFVLLNGHGFHEEFKGWLPGLFAFDCDVLQILPQSIEAIGVHLVDAVHSRYYH